MIERILSEVDKKHESSGGKSGVSIITLLENLNVEYSEIKEHLNTMHQNKQIRVRNGINGFLLFKV